jgi:hypothetical protein
MQVIDIRKSQYDFKKKQVGKRVQVIRPNHPSYGKTGKVVDMVFDNGFDWRMTIKLDDGGVAFVFKATEIKTLNDDDKR